MGNLLSSSAKPILANISANIWIVAHHHVNFSISFTFHWKCSKNWMTMAAEQRLKNIHLSSALHSVWRIRDTVTHSNTHTNKNNNPRDKRHFKVCPMGFFLSLTQLSQSCAQRVWQKAALGQIILQQRITEKSVFSANFFCVTLLLLLSLDWRKKNSFAYWMWVARTECTNTSSQWKQNSSEKEKNAHTHTHIWVRLKGCAFLVEHSESDLMGMHELKINFGSVCIKCLESEHNDAVLFFPILLSMQSRILVGR